MLWPTFKITPVIQRLNTKFYDPVLRRALFSGLPDLSEKVSSCYQLSHSGSQNHTSRFPPPPQNVFRLLKDKTSSPVFACHLAAVTRLHPRCCCWSFRDFNPSADARPLRRNISAVVVHPPALTVTAEEEEGSPLLWERDRLYKTHKEAKLEQKPLAQITRRFFLLTPSLAHIKRWA